MPRPHGVRNVARAPQDTDSAVLRLYYQDHEYLTSPEGILKVIAVVACIALGVARAAGAACGAAAGAAGAASQLASAALLAGLYAGAALRPTRAALPFFYTDLILSAVIGVLLLVTASLGMALCGLRRVWDILHGVVGVASAGVVTASAALTYRAVMRRLHPPAAPPAPPARPLAREHDV